MLYTLYRLGELIALNLPIRVSYKIAEFISLSKYYVCINDKKFVKSNLKVVLGQDSSDLDKKSKDVFKNFGKYLVEFFRFPLIDDEYIKKHVKTKNIELVDEALKQKKGLILLSAHLGNWELGGAALGMLGYKINVIALDHKDKRINNFFINRRVFKNMNVIPLGMALKKSIKALRNNEILAVLGDRDFSNTAIEVDFFNRPTKIPRGPAVLQIKTGAPIVTAFALREPDGTFTINFDKPEDIKESGYGEEHLKKITRSHLKVIENYVRRYPTQWSVFRSMWS